MAVKGWVATATLIALTVPGSLAVGGVLAADAVPRATHARHHRSHHHIVVRPVVDRRPVYGYLGRPITYIPAPFPLGFDFGFGW